MVPIQAPQVHFGKHCSWSSVNICLLKNAEVNSVNRKGEQEGAQARVRPPLQDCVLGVLVQVQ